ncbi:MAG: adenylate/guanylate cyclase domain-containing protein, partial [Planctomycetes bacterium]|nr:adenylate/guanylate cyclase domain-containing protein [Planctomycetota bacterium]
MRASLPPELPPAPPPPPAQPSDDRAATVAADAQARASVAEFQARHHTSLVALLFTDVVGSTALKQRLGDGPAVALLDALNAHFRRLLAEYPDGREIKHAGDSFFLVFARPSDAAAFALRAQSAVRREFSGERALAVRIGIHVGEVMVEEREDAPRELEPR